MAGSATERVYSGRRKVTLPEEDSSPSIGNFFRSVKESITGSATNLPDDEYEYADDEYEYAESGIENMSIESSEEEYQEIMGVISPRQSQETIDYEGQSDINTSRKIPLSRVKIISGATPAQLEENVNRYLNAIERDSKLANVSINDIKFSATQNGYSVLIWMNKV